MSEMIERVAKAIRAGAVAPDSKAICKFDDLGNSGKRMYFNMARAAIEAMREPTDKMKTAYREYAAKTADKKLYTSFTYGYTVMIDAALKE